MERLNKETLSFPALRIAQVIATLGMVLALVACGDKGGGGAAVVPPPVGVNGCMTCSGITNPVVISSFSMQSSDGSSWYGGGQPSMIFQNMQIFGQSSNYASAYNYQGPIALQGTLVVTKPVIDTDGYRQLSGCVLQPGTYYVQSNGNAQMGAAGQFQVPSMVSTSLSMELAIDAASYGGGLVGQSALAIVQIRSISGIQCSSNFYGQFGPSSGY